MGHGPTPSKNSSKFYFQRLHLHKKLFKKSLKGEGRILPLDAYLFNPPPGASFTKSWSPSAEFWLHNCARTYIPNRSGLASRILFWPHGPSVLQTLFHFQSSEPHFIFGLADLRSCGPYFIFGLMGCNH